MFDNIRNDFRAYKGDLLAQGLWAMIVYRYGRWRYGIKIRILRMPFSFLYHLMFKMIQILTGISLPCEAKIGKNFRIDHFGSIIISGWASFGDNCVIRTDVVVGLKNVDDPCAPQIGNNVDIGTGAKLLGRIKIGNNVKIGANAVVITDVPDNSIAVGVPARIISNNA